MLDYAESPRGRQRKSSCPTWLYGHNPAYGIMGQLVQKRGVIALGIEEALERRHLHAIGFDGIESPVAAVIC